MLNPDEGEFPVLPEHNGYSRDATGGGMGIGPGLTKRELFAAMAMQGISACHETVAHCDKEAASIGKKTTDAIAFLAVYQADALIAELNKEPRP